MGQSELRSTVEIVRSGNGMTRRAMARKHFEKVKVVSRESEDILSVLRMSRDIDEAVRQLKQMQRAKEEARKEREKPRVERMNQRMNARVNYSASNNWGLPNGIRVRKTPKGRLFFVNDVTKTTSWDDPRPLPSGWRSGKTKAGRVFYINDATKQT